jgi:hypothetical protein
MFFFASALTPSPSFPLAPSETGEGTALSRSPFQKPEPSANLRVQGEGRRHGLLGKGD